jgi:hypothetical protein
MAPTLSLPTWRLIQIISWLLVKKNRCLSLLMLFEKNPFTSRCLAAERLCTIRDKTNILGNNYI